MSDNQTMGFGKFVPGFDFLQNLAKGASQSMPQMPNLANWVAPTLNVEELEKRIGEMKAVHFWLDQNSKALGATIQALEVQKMTLATLKGMNMAMGDITNALKLKTADAMMGGLKGGATQPPASAGGATPRMGETVEPAEPAETSDTGGGGSKTAAKSKASPSSKTGGTGTGGGVVDPMQWWGALTQQFQQIAATAMKDVATQGPMEAARNMAGGMAREASKGTGKGTGKSATGARTAATRDAAGGKAKAAKKAPAKRAKKKGGA